MIRNKKLTRIIAIFFVLEMFADIALPYAAFALTSGPTAPETTSFEPVDTSTMVNLATGDFVYNIPLLEIPGPSGGYPLSLSYHAGIQPNEEASWVGLGWTLNAGSISRSVNGFADDHKNVSGIARAYWKGGETHIADIGYNVGIAGTPASISAGVSIAEDTYKGTGVGPYVQAGLALQHTGGSIRFGKSLYGGGFNTNVSASTSVGIINLSTDLEQVSGYVGLKSKYLDISISTSFDGQSSRNIGIVDPSAWENSKTGNISTSSFSFTLPLNYIYLGYKYQRYWMDESEVTKTNGSLYYPTGDPGDDRYLGYDTYSLLDPTEDGGIMSNPNSDKVLGGSFPNHDRYSVNAQGLSGNMRPYHYVGYVSRQSSYNGIDNYYNVKNINLGYNTIKPKFRFVGDFSNHAEYRNPLVNVTHGFDVNPTSIAHAFNGTFETGDGESGYNATSNELAGSKSIEYFTNSEIVSGAASAKGFIDTKSSGFIRNNETNNNSQIGGFKIVNSTGVSYHFALPVYSFQEYQLTENVDSNKSLNEISKSKKYAYTWNLTAITGPDYVDRNNNGFADKDDWGYWVEMDYGKWTDKYSWRNPGEGMNKDLDENFQGFSFGTKELYYLDAVKTETHTAIFVKDIRADAKGAVGSIGDYSTQLSLINPKNLAPTVSNIEEMRSTVDNARNRMKESGFYPINYDYNFISNVITMTLDNPDCDDISALLGLCEKEVLTSTAYYDNYKFLSKPVSTLKLSKIILIANDNYTSLPDKATGTKYVQNTDVSITQAISAIGSPLSITYKYHLPTNVFDTGDFEGISEDKYLKVIDFDSDYTLCSKTPNSYDSNLLQGDGLTVSVDTTFYQNKLLGKLTLNSVNFRGKKGANLVPPIFFNYAKNPSYDKDKYDIWGLYKGDYDPNEYVDTRVNENLLRMVTVDSQKDSDAWSLTTIGTSLGSKLNISYSAKSYNVSTYGKVPHYVKKVEAVANGKIRLTFFKPFSQSQINSIKLESQLELSSLFRHAGWARDLYESNWCLKNKEGISRYFYWNNFDSKNVTLDDVGIDYVDIIDSNLTNLMATALLGQACECFGENDGNKAWYDFNEPPSFIGGHVFFNAAMEELGGGIKVDRISVQNEQISNQIVSTKYQYLNGYTSYTPINFIDFTHIRFLEERNLITNAFQEKEKDALNSYYKFSNTVFSSILANARELVSPGVIYQKVKVEQWVDDLKRPGHTEYKFQTFKDDMVTIEPTPFIKYGSGVEDGQSFTESLIRKVTINDKMSSLGALLSITSYDDSGTPLVETVNHFIYQKEDYETVLNLFKKQGLISETFAEAKISRRDINNTIVYQRQGIVSERRQYPNIQTGQTNTNYKTGITTTSKNLEFDFFSGAVTKTLAEDSYGNYFVSETTPAYRKYPAMGLAINGGANMLTQVASSKSYMVTSGTDLTPTRLVGANANTWSSITNYNDNSLNQATTYSLQRHNDGAYLAKSAPLQLGRKYNFEIDGKIFVGRAYLQPSLGSVDYYINFSEDPNVTTGTTISASIYTDMPAVMKKHRSYSFLGNDVDISAEPDGLYPYTSFTEFDAWGHGTEPASVQWQKNSEITLFDVYSHALEAKDVNGNYAATKMDAWQEQVYATVANASYNEFCYSGVEEEIRTGVGLGGGVSFSGLAAYPVLKANGYPVHTGQKSNYVFGSTGGGFTYIIPSTSVTNRSYTTSVWVHMNNKNNVEVNVLENGTVINSISGAEIGDNRKAGDWYLFQLTTDLSGTTGDIEFQCRNTSDIAEVYMDDFRVHPIDAAMTSYVYNEWGELSHILDANNLYTEYVYDGMGRLKETHRESFEFGKTKVTQNEIVYARNDPGYAGYYSFETTLTKNNANSFTSAVTLGTPPYTYTWYKDNVQVRQVTNSISTDSYSSTGDCAFPIRCDVTDNRSRTRSMNGTGGVEWIASKNAWPTTGANTGNSFSVSVNSTCGNIAYKWYVSAPYGIDYLPTSIGSNSSVSYPFPECGEYKIKCVVSERLYRSQTLEGLMIVTSVSGTNCAL
jgi:hypothetical protein